MRDLGGGGLLPPPKSQPDDNAGMDLASGESGLPSGGPENNFCASSKAILVDSLSSCEGMRLTRDSGNRMEEGGCSLGSDKDVQCGSGSMEKNMQFAKTVMDVDRSAMHVDTGGLNPLLLNSMDVCGAAQSIVEADPSDALNSNHVQMDCSVQLHGPVHMMEHVESMAGFGQHEDAAQMEISNKASVNIFEFQGNFREKNNGISADDVVGMKADCILPNAGGFCMGSMDTNGTQSVRPFAAIKNPISGMPVVPPVGTGMDGGLNKSAWYKPVLVRLPERKDLGIGEERDGRVQLDVDEVLSTVKKFNNALVGRLFGRRLSFDYLSAELHRRWNGLGKFRLVTLSGDCFVCFFDSTEGHDAVLLGGPWVVAGQVIGVDIWTPMFSPSSNIGFTTPVWVRLPSLPMYCWGGKNIARIACLLGEPIYMDAATDRLERGHFARVCIRLDLSKPLLPGMWIDGPFGSFFQNVEYEGLSTFCFVCGHVGHKAEGCGNKSVTEKQGRQDASLKPSSIPVSSAEVGAEGNVETDKMHDVEKAIPNGNLNGDNDSNGCMVNEETSSSLGYGPWMLVTRKKKPPRGSPGRYYNSQKIDHENANMRYLNNKKNLKPPLPGVWMSKEDGQGRTMNRGVMTRNQSSASKDLQTPNDKCYGSSQTKTLPESSLDNTENGMGQPGSSSALPRNVKVKSQKASAMREVSYLGPLTHGSRNKKRRQVVQGDGGDASSLVYQ